MKQKHMNETKKLHLKREYQEAENEDMKKENEEKSKVNTSLWKNLNIKSIKIHKIAGKSGKNMWVKNKRKKK